jgi:KDO2-lipid IV(A) lauroyltransferase
MQLLLFLLVYPIIWFFSILPLPVLYKISDFLYYIVYYLFGYRKRIVNSNLKIAFSDKNEKEIVRLQKKFYRHFIDIFIEMLKSFTISESNLKRRYKFKNIEVIQKIVNSGKSVVMMGSHYANWEWVFILNTYVDCLGVAAYNRIENKYFDKAIRKSRGRFGTVLSTTGRLINLLEEHKKNNTTAIYGLLSDQSPMIKKTRYWRTFFNVKVPVHTGAEYLAKNNNFAVVMMRTKKIKRGFYESEFEILADNPKEFDNYQITDMFIERVEKQIIEKPEYYMWTHRRFKHKDKAPKL